VFRTRFSPYEVGDNRSSPQGEIGTRSFPLLMTVIGYCVLLTIGTIRISDKRSQLRIPAQPDCAPHRTTVSTSNARRGNFKIISAIWQFSGVNGACQIGWNNRAGRGFGDSWEKPYAYVGSLMNMSTTPSISPQPGMARSDNHWLELCIASNA
jgi:hypothetical protein